MTNAPLASLMASRTTCVLVFRAETVAPGITAFWPSTTVPPICPVKVCALTCVATLKIASSATARINFDRKDPTRALLPNQDESTPAHVPGGRSLNWPQPSPGCTNGQGLYRWPPHFAESNVGRRLLCRFLRKSAECDPAQAVRPLMSNFAMRNATARRPPMDTALSEALP